MKLKNVFVAISVILLLLLLAIILCFTLLRSKTMQMSELISILDIQITSEHLVDKFVEHPSNDSTSITLVVDYDKSIEKPAIFDLSQYEDTLLYHNLKSVIERNNMDISEVAVQIYFVQYKNRYSARSSLSVYVIIGSNNNGKQMLIYTVLPEHVKII